jgi:arylformamidase
MVQHPGPDREFAEWCKAKKIRWIGVDCGSADHPMLALGLQAQVNTIIRNWMPRQAAEVDKLFRAMYGTTMEERPDRDRRQVSAHAHRDVPLPHHPRRVPGRRHRSAAKVPRCLRYATGRLRHHHRLLAKRVAVRGRRVVHRLGALQVGRCVAFVDDAEYEEMMARKAAMPETRFGDGYNPEHVESIQRLTRRY